VYLFPLSLSPSFHSSSSLLLHSLRVREREGKNSRLMISFSSLQHFSCGTRIDFVPLSRCSLLPLFCAIQEEISRKRSQQLAYTRTGVIILCSCEIRTTPTSNIDANSSLSLLLSLIRQKQTDSFGRVRRVRNRIE
jgi:hypothetical protein